MTDAQAEAPVQVPGEVITQVKIIHPGLGPGSVSEVPESSLGTWYAAGWTRLTADNAPPPEEPPPAPEPVSEAQVAKSPSKAKSKSTEE